MFQPEKRKKKFQPAFCITYFIKFSHRPIRRSQKVGWRGRSNKSRNSTKSVRIAQYKLSEKVKQPKSSEIRPKQ